MTKKSKIIFKVLSIAILICVSYALSVYLLSTYLSTSKENSTEEGHSKLSSASNGWIKASTNIWTGVKIYYGPHKIYIGEVLGGNEKYVDPVSGRQFRGLKLIMYDGSVEWRDRNAIEMGKYYLKENDPALKEMIWNIYKY
jgi:hypothetical protein